MAQLAIARVLSRYGNAGQRTAERASPRIGRERIHRFEALPCGRITNKDHLMLRGANISFVDEPKPSFSRAINYETKMDCNDKYEKNLNILLTLRFSFGILVGTL